jgi:hypothetical protein
MAWAPAVVQRKLRDRRSVSQRSMAGLETLDSYARLNGDDR